MATNVIELYPPTGEELQHRGLYLRQDLRSLRQSPDAVFVYANFITSLDGRIAIPDATGEGVTLATQITNQRDWRLFQELAVQADVLITSGRYLREYQNGPKQELLQVYDDPAFIDLGAWRRERAMNDYPAVAVISRSLDFDVPQPLQEPGRELLIFTTENSDPKRRSVLESQTAKVIIAGQADVSGKSLIDGLQTEGYRWIYSTAGPRILHLLMAGQVLDRLYLTIVSKALGGDPFASILEGSLLEPPADFNIQAMYFDPQAPEGSGQFYCTFDSRSAEA